MRFTIKPISGALGMLAIAGMPLLVQAGGFSTSGKYVGAATPAMSAQALANAARRGSAPASTLTPAQQSVHGQTFGNWAAEWWQWAFGVPAATNPVTDTTGEFCAQRQVGNVWFLAGAYTSSSVVRACDIPAGKSLFFPLINLSYGAWLSDPPETQTEEFAREYVKANCVEPLNVTFLIDGKPASPSTKYIFTGESGSLSPIFTIQMPPGNVISDDLTVVPQYVMTPTAEMGYYHFLPPLPPGSHTLHWEATGCVAGYSQNITYNLNVLNPP